MGFVSTCMRQVARAAGASLVVPLVLLVAAGLVASGGGLGGISSLGQIASGPALPDIGLASAPASALEGAEIVGADVSEPGGSPPPLSPTEPLASGGRTFSAPPADARGLPPVRPPRPPSEPVQRQGPPTVRDEGAVPAPKAPGRPSGAPGPVQDVLETTRGVGHSLPGPLGPMANDILNLLLGSPRP